jgi:hypothetical protein
MATGDKKNKQNDPKTRDQLKTYFQNGKLPSSNDFSDLIDSVINIKEDEFAKHPTDCLKIRAVKDTERFMTLYAPNDINNYFKVDSDAKGAHKSLKIQWGTDENRKQDINENNIDEKYRDNPYDPYAYNGLDSKAKTADPEEDQQIKNAFFFDSKGKLGIGKRSENSFELDVNGFVGMKGRIGTYKNGAIPADKKWYKIIGPLNRCHAFEIVARTGWVGAGKFAMLHAIALSAFGKSRSKIRKTSAYYGAFWNKINLRWTGTTNAYFLEMRTNSNYRDERKYKDPEATADKDKDNAPESKFKPYEATDNKGRDIKGNVYIYYSITSLWDEDLMVPPDYFVKQENQDNK